MSKARTRTASIMPKRKARPSARSKPTALPVSLPPPASPEPTSLPPFPPSLSEKLIQTSDTLISAATTLPDPSKSRSLPSNSLIRQKVLAIIALRVQGKTNAEIAEILHVTPGTVHAYMYRAGKNGWLAKKAVDPTNRLEYEIAHKVVRNLDEMLDSDNESRRDQATMKTAEGTLFKQFADASAQAPPMAVIGIRIEMPAGEPTPIREGTTGGTMRWVEADIVPGDEEKAAK